MRLKILGKKLHKVIMSKDHVCVVTFFFVVVVSEKSQYYIM